MYHNVFSGRRVLVTGHTGFKGSWLTTWLLKLGAEVAGFSIDIPTTPSNFEILGLSSRIRDYRGDIRDRERFATVVDEVRPDIVLHLAAQALVRQSYEEPALTFEVNALGTLNVLEVLRTRPWIGAAIMVTSDKCYRNVEWVWGYRESDVLGGEDPYSGSKGAAELIAYAYISSFFRQSAAATAVATARAGNVIGGGDWAADRIVPDCVRAWSSGDTAVLRHPGATRPWQHVLEPLSGYLLLASRLWARDQRSTGESYNFGPALSVNESVETLIREIGQSWPAAKWRVDEASRSTRPEARLLKLSCDKALADLSWRTILTFPETVEFTAQWYRRHADGGAEAMFNFTLQQLDQYCGLAAQRGLEWALT